MLSSERGNLRPVVLEVIVNSVSDAIEAVKGGATRLEVSGVPGTETSPTPETVAGLRQETDLPIRVFLTVPTRFVADGGFLEKIGREINELREAGAESFVFGYLTDDGKVDVDAVGAVAEFVAGCPWTFHRAFDYSSDAAESWKIISRSGCDTLLTGGHRDGVTAGWSTLLQTLGAGQGDGPQVLVGGGLRLDHISPLAEAGARAFHIGTGAREVPRGPVQARCVGEYRRAIDVAIESVSRE